MSPEFNKLTDMTDEEYEKYALEIGLKPRKEFETKIIYKNQKQNKMIDQKVIWTGALVGVPTGVVAHAMGAKNPWLWGIGGAVIGGFLGSQAPSPTKEEKQSAVGSQATKHDASGQNWVITNPTRSDKFAAINSEMGMESTQPQRSDFYNAIGDWFRRRKSSSRAIGGGYCQRCIQWSGDNCILWSQAFPCKGTASSV